MNTRRHVILGASALPLVGGEALAAQAPSGLGAIRAVTITCADADAAADGWIQTMGYRPVWRGPTPAALARSWGAPALAGARMAIVGPESGEPVYLRFVRQAPPAGPAAAEHSWGWKTVEITVQNSDALYERLKVSPFKPDGPPRTVPTYDYLRAMQATGPAGERLNLTWIKVTRPDLAAAKSFVGKVFITVVAGPDLRAMAAWYKTVFGNTGGAIRQLPGLKLATVTLADGSKLELDEAPPGGAPAWRPRGGLPQGLALTTLACPAFDRVRERLVAPAIRNPVEPLPGAPSGVIRGPASELLELIKV